MIELLENIMAFLVGLQCFYIIYILSGKRSTTYYSPFIWVMRACFAALGTTCIYDAFERIDFIGESDYMDTLMFTALFVMLSAVVWFHEYDEKRFDRL